MAVPQVPGTGSGLCGMREKMVPALSVFPRILGYSTNQKKAENYDASDESGHRMGARRGRWLIPGGL